MKNSSILTGWFDQNGSCSDNHIASWILEHEQEMILAADYIFQNPELAYKETLASKCLADFMAKNGFTIEEKTDVPRCFLPQIQELLISPRFRTP